jgi:hypothetical protein
MTYPCPNIGAMRDIDIISQILTALGANTEDVEPQIVFWLGQQLHDAYEVLEQYQGPAGELPEAVAAAIRGAPA